MANFLVSITKMNNEIKEFNTKLNEMILITKTIKNIDMESNKVIESTYKTAEGIAYNTHKNAMHSKINARATTAIVFMKALWG